MNYLIRFHLFHLCKISSFQWEFPVLLSHHIQATETNVISWCLWSLFQFIHDMLIWATLMPLYSVIDLMIFLSPKQETRSPLSSLWGSACHLKFIVFSVALMKFKILNNLLQFPTSYPSSNIFYFFSFHNTKRLTAKTSFPFFISLLDPTVVCTFYLWDNWL